MIKFFKKIVLFSATLFLLCSCKIEINPQINDFFITYQQEKITTKSIKTGEVLTLDTAIAPSSLNKEATWSTSNAEIATVSNIGIVVGLKTGTCTITATSKSYQNVFANLLLKVTDDEPVNDFYITYQGSKASYLNLKSKSVINLDTTIKPTSYKKDALWTSSNPAIADVDMMGRIQTFAAGSVDITATSKADTSFKSTVTINVTSEITSDYYLGGYGHYVNGKNYSYDGGYKLNLNNGLSNDFTKIYEIKDAKFNVGDNFAVFASESELYQDVNISSSSGSFATKNMQINSLTIGQTSIDCLKTGYYDVKLTVTSTNQQLEINNGKETIDNLHSTKPSGTFKIDVFSFSDYHGNIVRKDYYPSIGSFTGYLNELIENANNDSIVINNGDLWQGSFYSNYNYGKLLNDCMSSVNIDAFVLGNHEYDWDEKFIYNNQGLASFPYLGANVTSFDGKVSRPYVQPYTIIEKSGLNIGVIGVIGEDRITSITSKNVSEVSFTNSVAAIEKYSDILRNDFACDIIIASTHDGVDLNIVYELSETSIVSGKRYVDGVIFGHDHSPKCGVSHGVPYVDCGHNGYAISNIEYTYNNGDISVSDYSNLQNSSNPSYTHIYEHQEDPDVKNIVNQYLTNNVTEKANSVAGKLSQSVDYNDIGPRMLARAMYNNVLLNNYNVDIAMANKARSYLPKGDVTYNDIFTAFPFSNTTVIMEAKGADIINEAGYSGYYAPVVFQVQSNQTYRLAIYDYLAFHQNSSRQYDYFRNSTPFKIIAILPEYPADYLFDYLSSFKEVIDIDQFNTRNFNFIS